MSAPRLSSSNHEMPSELSEAENALFVAVPWSEFGTRHPFEETADSPMPRRALEQAIESALLAGQALFQGRRSMHADIRTRLGQQFEISEADSQADVEPAGMRHAYRGRDAYSSLDSRTCGRRLLAEDLAQLSSDPHWAYLNSTPDHDHGHDADVAEYARRSTTWS